jgi:RNA polymerase sigma factor (TIGR02999 family)
MSEVTHLLDAAAAGDRKAAADLLPLVYEELRMLAATRMAAEPDGHSLDPTALVHEAYLRLVGAADAAKWNGRGHFFAAAAEAMRRVLIDHARRRRAAKRGAGAPNMALNLEAVHAPEPDNRLISLDEALSRLAQDNPLAAKVVELRQFAGLDHEAVAATLGITVYAARQNWTYARAWLRDALDGY